MVWTRCQLQNAAASGDSSLAARVTRAPARRRIRTVTAAGWKPAPFGRWRVRSIYKTPGCLNTVGVLYARGAETLCRINCPLQRSAGAASFGRRFDNPDEPGIFPD